MALIFKALTSNYFYILAILTGLTVAAPALDHASLDRRQSTGKMVFCHFMMGIVADRTSAADYDNDMTRAKSFGIDAFALNIGMDDFTDAQLGYAYQSAANNGMKVFISFDFNWWKTSQAAGVGAKIKQYGGKDAQLKVGANRDQVFVSSFAGDGLDLDAVRSAAGIPLFVAPNFQASNAASGDGAFNWMAWASNGDNKAPAAGNNVTLEDGDSAYIGALSGKPYMAPASPWFSTHYGSEVSYAKNWVFPSDLLWYNRWTDILTLGAQYVEIITWNDYGESHYIGPLSSPHDDDGNSKWVNDMPHDGWLEMAKPYIAAYKAGSQSVGDYIKSDQIIYWYRPAPKSAGCDSTDNVGGLPSGADTVSDSIFVVALLTEAGTVQVSSGSNSQTFNGQAGANAWAVDMGTGKQSFSLSRGGSTVLSGTSLKDISADCICGIYNFNAYVGTLPAGQSDSLQSPDGFQGFASGLAPGICQPNPSLGTAPAVSSPTATSGSAGLSAATMHTSSHATSVAKISSSLRVSSIVTPIPPIATATASPVITPTFTPFNSTPANTPTVTTTPAAGGGSTITALNQLFPSNCMQASQIWAGPAGADPPAKCDG